METEDQDLNKYKYDIPSNYVIKERYQVKKLIAKGDNG